MFYRLSTGVDHENEIYACFFLTTYTHVGIIYIYPLLYMKEKEKRIIMKGFMKKLEQLLELGGIKKDVVFLGISGVAVICSLLKINPFPFDMAWIAIILCGIPIILEAVIGLVTEFDIKADVLVSLALIASICIGETFAAGEVAFIFSRADFLRSRRLPEPEQVLKNWFI